ncbi:MAG: acetylxylan esterase [Methylococcales bacterium]
MPDLDPTDKYTLEQLLAIEPPPQPENFGAFWQARYARAMEQQPRPWLNHSNVLHPDFECYDFNYHSTDNFEIGGWVLIPKHAPVTRGVVVGHGYGGRNKPNFDIPISGAAFLFPCSRGLSRSRRWPISDDPQYHVLHDIDKKDRYILGGCVEDLWLAVSALLVLFPAAASHVAYFGTSFGGGIGALALPWDSRIQRAHFRVPSFGHHPLRLQLPTRGSAAAVQRFQREHGSVLDTLAYYDAAVAARNIQVPIHVAAALVDPAVTPPGQFSIYNAILAEKKLFVFEKGHSNYPRLAAEEKALQSELREFFSEL